jgi:DNA-binding MarR family transcriptional regulator
MMREIGAGCRPIVGPIFDRPNDACAVGAAGVWDRNSARHETGRRPGSQVPERSIGQMAKPRTLYLLRQLHSLAYSALVDRLRALDLTPVQYMVLSLSSREGGLSSADLARRAKVTPQTMNEIVAALERKTFVRRREDAGNRRILRVAVTGTGREVLARCDAQVDGLERELFRGLPPDELAVLRSTMARIIRDRSDTAAEAAKVEAPAEAP